MIKKVISYFCFIIVLFITVISGINGLSNINKNYVCNTEIKSASLSATEKDFMKHTKRNVRVIYTYVYNGQMYVGEQYTSKEVIDKSVKNNELKIYISKNNPSVSIIDKKHDIIIVDISECVCGLVIMIYIINRNRKKCAKVKK